MKKYSEIEQEFDNVFTPKKKYSLKYADVLKRIGEDKRYGKVVDCASFFEFGLYSDETFRLHRANFCHDVLCPQCAKRKSLKLFHQVSSCVRYLSSDYSFLFITLTVKNCSSFELSETCDFLQSSYVKLMDRKRMSFVKGSFRALEITHDNDEYITRDMYFGNKQKHMGSRVKHFRSLGLKVGDKNPNFDKYHPHIHAILVVDKSYFTSSDFLDYRELSALWKDVLRVDYPVVVDIRACKNKNFSKDGSLGLSSAVAEVAKYSVKGSDFLSGSDELNDRTVRTLLSCLKNRKMFQFYGVFRKVRQLLSLEDDDDLVNVSDTKSGSQLVAKLFFAWDSKFSTYVHVGVREVDPDPDDVVVSIPPPSLFAV